MHCSSVMRSPTSARVHRRATSTKPFVEAGGASSQRPGPRGAPASEKQWSTGGRGPRRLERALRRQQLEQHHAERAPRLTPAPGARA